MGEHPENLGTRPVRSLPVATFPDVGQALVELPTAVRPAGAVDVLFVNPPAPDGGIWIRSQHRVGRRSRENMIWPQVSLAQLAAMVSPNYSVDIIDAIPSRMTWQEFEGLVAAKRPRYYITQVTAPTLTNDMRGTFLARSLGARTIAFGTHVTPLPGPTLQAFPTLDYVLRGEPELTLRELLDTLEGREMIGERLLNLFREHDVDWRPGVKQDLGEIKGLAWRDGDCRIRLNPDRPFIRNLDDLPLPMHHLLPWKKYRVAGMKGPFTFIVPS
ncbi:MAG: radical SAM protein, partial [Chloroflexi bacterium]